MKSDEELDKILSFILEADRLKGIDRTGWVREGVIRPEHVGDHSFSVALMSYLMAKKLGLDAGKCLLMGLIHNINEAGGMGDIATRPKEADQIMNNSDRKKLEYENARRVLSALDAESHDDLWKLWVEAREITTKEARLVEEVDKLDYVFMLVPYSRYLSTEAVEEFLGTGDRVVKIPELRHIYEGLRKKVLDSRRGV